MFSQGGDRKTGRDTWAGLCNPLRG